MKPENTKYWKNQAITFSAYARDDYNEDRALACVVASHGHTFQEDIRILVLALRNYGDDVLADLIENDNMFPCGSTIPNFKK